MKKIEQKIKDGKQSAEIAITNNVSLMHQGQLRDRALIMFGAVGAINHIAKSLSAQTIRGLQKIREEKVFEAFGFSRFDDFLDEYENSPMTYRQFNERENLLKMEGDELFDILNKLKISQRQRKLLGAGNVELDGEIVIIKSLNDAGEEIEEEIEVNDRERLLQTLSAIADQNTRLNLKTDKQKKQIEKQDGEISDLSERIQRGTNGAGSLEFEYFLRAKTALSKYREHIESDQISPDPNVEKYLRDIYGEFCRLRQVYGRNDLRFDESSSPEENEFTGITSSLNDADLASLME